MTARISGEHTATYACNAAGSCLVTRDWHPPSATTWVWPRFGMGASAGPYGALKEHKLSWDGELGLLGYPENVWPLWDGLDGHVWRTSDETTTRIVCLKCNIRACDVPGIGVVYLDYAIDPRGTPCRGHD